MKNKQNYYSLEKMQKTEADYKILFGERSNGKSYAVTERFLYIAFNEKDKDGTPIKKYQFGYVRRWKEDIKGNSIEKYFEDKKELIKKITNNEYDTILAYQASIYFGTTDPITLTVKKGKKIGVAFCLTSETHYKSLQFPLMGRILYEEFITSSGYLPNEPKTLQSLVSTIARREKIEVYLIGNTMSRLCPYFREWSLKNVLRQKQGTIDLYSVHTKQINEDGTEIIITIAVEYCENSGNNSKMFFGKNAKMITTGTWDSDEYPHLDDNINTYVTLYKIRYEYNDFTFTILLIEKNNNFSLFIYPATKDSKYDRKISNLYSVDNSVTVDIVPFYKYDVLVIYLLENNKILFSDNLTGTEFYQIKKEKGGKW